MRVAAVVLAAGRSRRMGAPKAWLELDGEPLLTRITRVARAAGADPVVVVTGTEMGDELVSNQRVVERLGRDVEPVVGMPDGHPIDSLRAGLSRLPDDCAVLLWPVDHPFADTALVAAMVTALGEESNRVVIPESARGWGHPVLFGPTLVRELQSPLANGGARAVVRGSIERVVRVPARDDRVAAELNTPEQAAHLGVGRS